MGLARHLYSFHMNDCDAVAKTLIRQQCLSVMILLKQIFGSPPLPPSPFLSTWSCSRVGKGVHMLGMSLKAYMHTQLLCECKFCINPVLTSQCLENNHRSTGRKATATRESLLKRDLFLHRCGLQQFQHIPAFGSSRYFYRRVACTKDVNS